MLTPGTALELTFPVTETLTAKTVGSGTLDVLATPVMIARMEQAAWTAVAPSLSPEEGTVGTWMNVKHLSKFGISPKYIESRTVCSSAPSPETSAAALII